MPRLHLLSVGDSQHVAHPRGVISKAVRLAWVALFLVAAGTTGLACTFDPGGITVTDGGTVDRATSDRLIDTAVQRDAPGTDVAPPQDSGQADAQTDAQVDAPPSDGPPDAPIICGDGGAPHVIGDLTEADVARWGGENFPPVTNDTITVTGDTSIKVAGARSIRMSTENGQAGLFYPKDQNAGWDLTGYTDLMLKITASNGNPGGWRVNGPRIRIASSKTSFFEYRPVSNFLPVSSNTWVTLYVPLNGGAGWLREAMGTPSLDSVAFIEFTATTWEAGFSLWVDDLDFNPGPFIDCSP